MNQQHENGTSRRELLKGAAAGGLAVGAGAGAVTMLSSPVAAQATSSLDIGGTDIVADTGQVAVLKVVDIGAAVEWANFDGGVEGIQFDLTVEFDDESKTFTRHHAFGGASSGSLSTSFADIDLLDVFGDDAFDVAQSGDVEEPVTETFSIDFELTVTVSGPEIGGVSDTVGTSADVTVTNLGVEVEVGGEGTIDGAPWHDLGTSPTNPDADVETEGVMQVLAAYPSEDRYLLRVDLDEPWADPDEVHANFGVGLDFDLESEEYQYQLNWSAERGFFHHINATELVEGLPDGITAERVERDGGSGAVFTFDIDVPVVNDQLAQVQALPEDGEEFGYVGNASYGGATHANVSTDPTSAWDGDHDTFPWSANTYFLTSTVDVA